MKRLLGAMLAWVAVLSFMVADAASATPHPTLNLPAFYLAAEPSIPPAEDLATMTPDEKKQFFMKKKEMYMPTTESITEKIETGFKNKGVALPAGVKEKIDAALKRKGSFIPSPEVISKKIEAAMSAFKQ